MSDNNNKSHIWYSSRFWVILYAFVVILFMCIQFVLGLLESYQVTFHNTVINKFINGNLNLPITVLSYGWTLLVSMYTISDKTVDVLKTAKLQPGDVSFGDLSKSRGLILLSMLLLFIAVIFNFLVDKDFDLTAFASAFVMITMSYVVGNKMVKSASWWKVKGLADNNGDLIPDKYEDRYNKWKRQQEKNGVDSQYINFDYFLDDTENSDIEKEIRSSSIKTN